MSFAVVDHFCPEAQSSSIGIRLTLHWSTAKRID